MKTGLKTFGLQSLICLPVLLVPLALCNHTVFFCQQTNHCSFKSSLFQLGVIVKIKPQLHFTDLEKVSHASISFLLDYSSALGLDQSSLRHLQIVQNAAAHLLPGTDQITRAWHLSLWLPAQSRIDFKILLFTFKVLNGSSPSHLSDLLHIHTFVRAL